MKEVAPVSNDPKADENNNDNNNHNNSNNHNNNNNKKSSPRRTRSMKVAEEDLSFQTLTVENNGHTVTKEHKIKLRERYGYCLSCQGVPVLCFDIQKSRFNPLSSTKVPRTVDGECLDGTCLKCHPTKDPRRKSFAMSKVAVASSSSSTSFSARMNHANGNGSAGNTTAHNNTGSSLLLSRQQSRKEIQKDLSNGSLALSRSRRNLFHGNNNHNSNYHHHNNMDAASNYGGGGGGGGGGVNNNINNNNNSINNNNSNNNFLLSGVHREPSNRSLQTGSTHSISTNNTRRDASASTRSIISGSSGALTNLSAHSHSAHSTSYSLSSGSSSHHRRLELSHSLHNQGNHNHNNHNSNHAQPSTSTSSTSPSSLLAHIQNNTLQRNSNHSATTTTPPPMMTTEGGFALVTSPENAAVEMNPTTRRVSSLRVRATTTSRLPPSITTATTTTSSSSSSSSTRSVMEQQVSSPNLSTVTSSTFATATAAATTTSTTGSNVPSETELYRFIREGSTSSSLSPSFQNPGRAVAACHRRRPPTNHQQAVVQGTKRMPTYQNTYLHRGVPEYASHPTNATATASATASAIDTNNNGNNNNGMMVTNSSSQDEHHGTDPTTATMKHETFANLSSLLDGLATAGDYDFLLEVLLNAMQTHYSSTDIQSLCLETLVLMCQQDPSNLERLGELPVVMEELVICSKNFPCPSPLRAIAARTMATVAVNSKARLALVQAGACRMLVRMLQNCSSGTTRHANGTITSTDTSEAAEAAMAALRGLSTEPAARDSLDSMLACKYVCQAMDGNRAMSPLLRDGCAFLSNVSVDIEHEDVAVVSRDVLQAIVGALRMHTTDIGLVSVACFALQNLTCNNYNLRTLRNIEGVFELFTDSGDDAENTMWDCQEAYDVLDRLQLSRAEDESLEDQASESLQVMIAIKDGKPDVIPEVVDLLKNFEWSVRINVEILRALDNLLVASYDQYRQIVVDATQAAMQAHQNSDVQSCGKAILNQLDKSPEP